MSLSNAVGLPGRFRVGTKIMLISGFYLLALLLIIVFTVVTANRLEDDSVIIELVGRQRMLQKQHVVETLLLGLKPGDSTKLQATRQVWKGTQEALISGGQVQARLDRQEMITVQGAETEQLRLALQGRLRLIQQSIQASDRYLATAGNSPEREAALQTLLESDEELSQTGIDFAKQITNHALERTQSLINMEIGIGLVVGVAGLLLGWGVGRGVARPLQQVVRSAESIAQGDLRVDKLSLATGDEVAQLASAFNHMLDNLKDLSSQIIGVTGNVNSATAEILASTQQQASSTKEQAATVQEITTTMQEISQSGTEITERAKQVAAAAEATSAVSNSGIAAVQNTSRIMQGIRQQVEEVAAKIVALSEKTQAIGEIVNTVNDISEQTNLLALNASIEAASAGEQGSRFAVVASEMRNLAARAKESTVQVGSILSEIQRGINSSVMLAEEAMKRSESGKHQAEVTEKTIHQMMQTTVDSINAFQQIIGATNQQQIGFDQVAQGMRDIRQAAEQTAVGTSQLEQALNNLNELSRQLRTAVSRYRI